MCGRNFFFEMFESVLLCICPSVLVYNLCKLFNLVQVRDQPVVKRKYAVDKIDLTDEPQAKKPRFEEIKVMRVLLMIHDEILTSENSDGLDDELFYSDDDEIWSYLSDSTIEDIEYFNEDLHRYLNETENLSDSCSESNSSDVILVERSFDTISVSSESSSSIVLVSSSSSVAFVHRTNADVPINGK